MLSWLWSTSVNCWKGFHFSVLWAKIPRWTLKHHCLQQSRLGVRSCVKFLFSDFSRETIIHLYNYLRTSIKTTTMTRKKRKKRKKKRRMSLKKTIWRCLRPITRAISATSLSTSSSTSQPILHRKTIEFKRLPCLRRVQARLDNSKYTVAPSHIDGCCCSRRSWDIEGHRAPQNIVGPLESLKYNSRA